MVNKQLEISGWQEEAERMYLVEGKPLSQVCQQLGQTYQRVRKTLEARGVEIRGRGTYSMQGADHPASKLCQEDRNLLEAEILAGKPHSKLSRAYGLSRERVRQIAHVLGAPTGREIQLMARHKKEQARQHRMRQRQQRREEQRDEHYRRWRELWREGLPIRDIAHQLGLKPASVGVRIANLRKEYPGWFPRRR